MSFRRKNRPRSAPRVRRRKVAAMASAVVAPTAMTMTVAAEPAAAYKPYHYTSNICGANGCGHQGLSGASFFGGWWTTFEEKGNPYTLGIQEACSNQMDSLKGWLSDRDPRYGIQRHYQAQVGAECGLASGTRGYGTAMIAITPSNPSRFAGPFPTQAPSDENRGYACIEAGAAGDYWACTAHMNFIEDATYRFTQTYEYYNYYVAPKGNVVWGGDLYVRPNEWGIIPSVSFSTNQEVDWCEGSWRWTQRLKNAGTLYKHDYVFYRNGACPSTDAFLRPSTTGEVYPNGWWKSDHRLLAGW